MTQTTPGYHEVARPTRFVQPDDARGKWHAANRVTGTAVCGAPVVLSPFTAPVIVPAVGTPWERVHPLVCRRCLHLATSIGLSPIAY